MKRICAVFMALLLSSLMLVAPITASAEYIYDGNSDKYTYTLALSDEQCETIIENAPSTNKYTNTTGSRYLGLDYAIINTTVADGETFYQPVCAYIGYQNTANQVQVTYIYARSKTEKPRIEKIDDIYTLTSDNEKEFGQIRVVYDTNSSACTNGWTHAILDEISLVEDLDNPIMTINATYGGEYTTHLTWFMVPDLTLCPELGYNDFGRGEVTALVDPEPFIGMTSSALADTDGFFQVSVHNNSDTYYQTAIEIVDSQGNVVWRDNAQEMHYADTAGDYGAASYAVLKRLEILPDFVTKVGDFLDGLGSTSNIMYRLHDVQQQFGYSWWHITKPTMPYMQMYQWDDIDIYAEAVYTLNVYAIPSGEIATDFTSIPSNNWDFRYENVGGVHMYYFDEYSDRCNSYCPNREVLTLYSKQFSFQYGSAPTYNPNNENIWNDNKDNGYSPNWKDDSYSIYVDGDTGAYIPTGNTGAKYDYSTDFGDIDISDMQSLFDNTGGFMAFLQGIFECLPPFMWTIIAAGLTAVIVLRILGR